MNAEELPRGHAPNGSFYSSERVKHSFFETDAEEDQETRLKEHMPFLHSLIYTKLKNSIVQRNKTREKRSERKDKVEVEGLMSKYQMEDIAMKTNDFMEFQCDKRRLDVETGESMEGISHSEEISSSLMDRNRLKHVGPI